MPDTYTFAKRVLLAAFLVLLTAAGFYLLGKQAYFFLLVFAGVLMAVMFCGITDWIVGKTHMKRGIALLLSVILFFGLLIGAFWLLAPTVGQQIKEMQQTLPQALASVESWVSSQSWGDKVLDKVPEDLSSMLPKQKTIISGVTGAFSTVLGFLTDFFIVVITALFFASNPKLYTHGFTRLFPVKSRTRVLEVLDACYTTLKLWLVAMLLAMAIIGISTAIGYSLIGLPLAFALAFIAFLFAFIPNIGPWVAGLPALLLGLTEGGQMALYVLLIYGGIQLFESYLITPLIFQKTVDLPPALLLFFQVLLGILLGAMGLLLAAPILAVIMVLVQELYVKDVLEKPQVQKPVY